LSHLVKECRKLFSRFSLTFLQAVLYCRFQTCDFNADFSDNVGAGLDIVAKKLTELFAFGQGLGIIFCTQPPRLY
jgi:hypothetical protein